MDSYFPKTRRPTIALSNSLKRPAQSITPPKPAKIPATPSTPKDARLPRPLQPPPVRRKNPSNAEGPSRLRKQISVKELFKSHSQAPTEKLAEPLKKTPVSPSKITSGPLKGVSTSLLDLIRAKEAAAKAITPREKKQRELLGIAPDIVRIVPTVFTVNKRDIMSYDKVIEKCHKGLKSNYSTETIIECLELMNKVAPNWITTVTISKGTYMRISKELSIPQLLEAIRRFERNC